MINWLKEKFIDKFLDYFLGYIWLFISAFLWNNNHIWIWRIILIFSIILLFFTLYLYEENKKLKSILLLNQKPPLTEKEKLEIKLLKYIKENQGQNIEPANILHITDDLYYQIDLLESLYSKSFISYKTINDNLIRQINNYTAVNVSITMNGKEYLDNIEVEQ